MLLTFSTQITPSMRQAKGRRPPKKVIILCQPKKGRGGTVSWNRPSNKWDDHDGPAEVGITNLTKKESLRQLRQLCQITDCNMSATRIK
jgi:hypothetical protein